MSEQPHGEPPEAGRAADKAGATSEEFGNLSIEDDPEGTVHPGDLAGTAASPDDADDAHDG